MIGSNQKNAEKKGLEASYKEDIEGVEENASPGSFGRGMYRIQYMQLWKDRDNCTGRLKLQMKQRVLVLTRIDQMKSKASQVVISSFQGADAMEWLRDCEEYFTIYEVHDGKRAAIV